ncbi:MAG: hypothetical protein RSA45_04455 [Hydrogenoanaerobacterium sp.]
MDFAALPQRTHAIPPPAAVEYDPHAKAILILADFAALPQRTHVIPMQKQYRC